MLFSGPWYSLINMGLPNHVVNIEGKETLIFSHLRSKFIKHDNKTVVLLLDGKIQHVDLSVVISYVVYHQILDDREVRYVTDSEAFEIFTLLVEDDLTRQQIADRFGITYSTVTQIANRSGRFKNIVPWSTKKWTRMDDEEVKEILLRHFIHHESLDQIAKTSGKTVSAIFNIIQGNVHSTTFQWFVDNHVDNMGWVINPDFDLDRKRIPDEVFNRFS